MDANTWNGVQAFIDDYAGITSNDFVVILYSSDSYEVVAWVSAALELRRIDVRRVWMMPLNDPGFVERLEPVLPDPGDVVGNVVVISFEKNTMSHTSSLMRLLSRYDKRTVKILRSISACRELFSEAFAVSPGELERRNSTLLKILMNTRKLRVTTEAGSDLMIELDNGKHRWISNRGRSKLGHTTILPAGEIATFPAAINGRLVADYAFNVNAITEVDSRLESRPVEVEIANGRAVDFKCPDDTITNFLRDCFHSYCAYNVGELGIGTNPALIHPIHMNSHINERRCGVHVGFGQHNQDPGVVSYYCPVHLDLIAKGGKLWIDDRDEPIDLEHFTVIDAIHPSATRDEDVFSPEFEDLEIDDCCGVLTNEGLGLFRTSECSR
jgi:hypothetical protein